MQLRTLAAQLHTVAREVNVQVPKLPRQTLETAIIRRYRRRESLVGEALDRDVPGGDFSPAGRGYNRGALGTRVSPSTVSNPEQEDLRRDRGWRKRRIEGNHLICILMALSQSKAGPASSPMFR